MKYKALIVCNQVLLAQKISLYVRLLPSHSLLFYLSFDVFLFSLALLVQ